MRAPGGPSGAAVGLYRVLLGLLPRELRERHGAAMLASFEAELAAARREEPGAASRTGTVVRGYGDVLGRALYERGRRVVPGPGMWSNLSSDLRFAFRTFVRRPGITVVAVLMLSLGVAATAAVFTVADSLFLRPLPFPDADRLVYLDETAPAWNLEYVGIRYYDFARWSENQEAFEGLGLISTSSFNLSSESGVERVMGAEVTHGLAAALRMEPVLGRTFTAEEDSPGGPPVVMLGHELWRQQFGGDPGVIGTTVRLDGRPRTVVGVLPPAASFLEPTKLWVPMAKDPTVQAGFSYQGIGRLKAGVSMEAARSDLTRVQQSIWEEDEDLKVVMPLVMPLRERLTGSFRTPTLALALAVGLVLLIACGNVASILLARSFSRRRELGVRAALGAPRGRIARQLFGESFALALVAGPLGVVLGFVLVRALAAGLPTDLPSWMALEPSWRMVLFALATVIATALLFGWAPIVQASRTGVRSALGEGGERGGASRGQRRTMDVLVVAEIALATLLLVGGGLLVRSFQELQEVEPGFRTSHVVSFRVALPESTYPDTLSRSLFYDRLLAGLEAQPGVRAVGAIDCPPLSCHSGAFFAAEGGLGTSPDDANPVVLYRVATPGYFDAMGIETRQGRGIRPDDRRPGARDVVVINETFARTFLPGIEDPIGLRVAPRGRPFTDSTAWEIVGVARDVKHYGVDEEMRPGLYFPLRPGRRASLAVFAWTENDPTALLGPARRLVAELDPELPLFQVGTTEAALRESLALRRAATWAMMVFATLALVLAVGGIYGVLSYIVGQRSRELGIRVALGATRARVLRLVLRHGLVLGAAGTGIGLVAALAGGRALQGSVGIHTGDPLIYVAAALLLIVAALAASLAPARRALSVEAGSALRAE